MDYIFIIAETRLQKVATPENEKELDRFHQIPTIYMECLQKKSSDE